MKTRIEWPVVWSAIRSMWVVLRIAFFLVLALICGIWLGRAVPLNNTWQRADLRALDPADARDPATDITALYTRQAGFHCQIRLDILDLPEVPQYDLAISLGQRALRVSNDLVAPQGVDVSYDAVREMIVVDLADCSPPASTPLVVQTYGPASALPADEVQVAFGGAPLAQQVRVQFAFYNLFSPAATAAQALRRWDGAHTGPRGERHGLHELLSAAENFHIPLTLLDLKTPVSLSAIDFLGGMDQLRRMERAELLEMPAVVYGIPQDSSLARSHSVADRFGLLVGNAYFDALQPTNAVRFLASDGPDDGGLSLKLRRSLLEVAISGKKPLVLGGDFQKTTWGTPDYVRPAFEYLAARPYIVFVSDALPLSAGEFPPEQVTETAVRPLYKNKVMDSALEAYFLLQSPAVDPTLAHQYSGLVGSLINAAQWVDSPKPMAGCISLCFLASDGFYASLDPHGARLVFFFAGSDQLVGPTAQFFVGISDRLEWDLTKGQGADPAQVMGAFADADDAFRAYTPEVLDANTIRFTSADGRVKTYRLVEAGLEVQLSGPVETDILLVVSPEKRFSPGWAGAYTARRETGRIGWGLATGPLVWVAATGATGFSLETSLDGHALALSPEDPNLEYPAGIYLPFPLALVHLSSSSAVTVTIFPDRN